MGGGKVSLATTDRFLKVTLEATSKQAVELDLSGATLVNGDKTVKLARDAQRAARGSQLVTSLGKEAPRELVLFFDDDLIPDTNIVAAHGNAHRDDDIWAVAGQVLQPGEEVWSAEATPPLSMLNFRFNSARGMFVTNVMAGNLSVKRARALEIGGFDENFVGAAYRFETDFAMRVAAAGGKIWFEPGASVRHLQLATGGLRSYGDHRSAPVPAHSAGDYYFALHHAPRFWSYAARRIRQNVATRYLAAHPWLIPAKLIGETRGLLLALGLHRKGRRLRVVPPGKPS